jgi:hypothetical protein
MGLRSWHSTAAPRSQRVGRGRAAPTPDGEVRSMKSLLLAFLFCTLAALHPALIRAPRKSRRSGRQRGRRRGEDDRCTPREAARRRRAATRRCPARTRQLENAEATASALSARRRQAKYLEDLKQTRAEYEAAGARCPTSSRRAARVFRRRARTVRPPRPASPVTSADEPRGLRADDGSDGRRRGRRRRVRRLNPASGVGGDGSGAGASLGGRARSLSSATTGWRR